MPTTLPITRALALLLVGPLLASACAAGDGDEEADPAGQADVAVSVVDADGSGDDADGAASGEVVADSADRAGGGGADGGGPNSGGGADGTVLDLTSPQTVSGRIEVALAADRYTFQAEPGEKLSVQIDANSQAGCRDETWPSYLEVTDADGQVMELDTFTDNVGVYGCEGYGPWSLEGRSPFTVSLVSGGPVPEGEGYYEAVLAKLALDEETVEIDEPIAISGRLDVARDSDTWLFDAGPDELLSVQITGMGAGACPDELWPLVVAVTDANGEVMDIGSSDNAGVYGCDAYGPFTLDGDAPYALTFTSNGPVLEGQGEYEATLALVG